MNNQMKRLEDLTTEDAIKGICNTLNSYNSELLIKMVWETILLYEDNYLATDIEKRC